MRPKDRNMGQLLTAALSSFSKTQQHLPGIANHSRRQVLVEQILESIHRVNYIYMLCHRPLGRSCCDPTHGNFNPVKAAIQYQRDGDFDEACWLVFLATNFAYHRHDGWQLMQDIYRCYDGSHVWTWQAISRDLNGFIQWAEAIRPTLAQDTITRRFGSHRQYASLKYDAPTSAIRAVEGYVRWIGPNRGHRAAIQCAIGDQTDSIPADIAFDNLFCQMKQEVPGFGRLGTFDYLNMLKKVGLVEIEPGIPYLEDATGPRRGANLLFYNENVVRVSARTLDQKVKALGNHLGLGMQVMEDALCNWQKSPAQFRAYRG